MNRSIYEIVAVLLTGLAKFLFIDLIEARFWFIIVTALFWSIYFLICIRRDKTILNKWGFRKKGFFESIRIISIPALIVLISSAAYGIVSGTIIFKWHILPVLILYPLWGTIQQFLIISIFGGNLSNLKGRNVPPSIIILLTATLFGIVHYPSIPLIIATFLLAVFYMLLFLRFRNLWALGLFHGFLGCIFYFFILGRDPWIELIGTI